MRQIFKPRVFTLKQQLNNSRWTVTLFSDYNFRLIIFRIFIFTFTTMIIVFSVKQHNNISILLDTSTITKIAHPWPVTVSGLCCTVELTQYNDRNIKLTCQ